MKILILDWGAFTQPDINADFTKNGTIFRTFYYKFKDKNFDPYFYRHFTEHVKADVYDAVFSVNFFPLVAKVCHECNVKYLSWSYDNPLNVPNIEESLGFETNFVFLFDRIQVAHYQNKGFTNVYHLPLAVNPDRLSSIRLSSEENKIYHTDISFVGKLYPSTFHNILALLGEYEKGYLESIANIQSKLYGCYLIDDLLREDIMIKINSSIQDKLGENAFTVSREQLSYSIATNVTREERLILLNLLSKRHRLFLYSNENHPLLSSASYRGTIDYLTGMPKVFYASKINLNISLKILQSGIPLRALDILGSGGFLLSNFQPELSEFLQAEREIVLYTDIQDAIEKANFYLQHEDLRQEIATAGRTKVFEKFNYTKQLTTLFTTAGIL